MTRRLPKWWRIALLALIILTVWIVGWATGLHEVVTVDGIRQYVLDAGVWGVAIFALIFCIGQLAQIGGHPFIAASVLIWGWWPGALISAIAAFVAVTANFVFSRTIGGNASSVENEKLQWVVQRLNDAPIRTMIVARFLLMTAPLLSTVVAVGGVRHRDHAIASVVGLMPSVFVASYMWSVGFDWFL